MDAKKRFYVACFFPFGTEPVHNTIIETESKELAIDEFRRYMSTSNRIDQHDFPSLDFRSTELPVGEEIQLLR